jgi:lysophospholipase L1-like esterase
MMRGCYVGLGLIAVLLTGVTVGMAQPPAPATQTTTQAATQPQARPVAFDTYPTGYFVSNQFEPDAPASYVVLKNQKAFDDVFGVARVMGPVPKALPADAFRTQYVLGVIKRGNSLWHFQVDSVTVQNRTLTVKYKAMPEAGGGSAEFACPLIIEVPHHLEYTAVEFLEQQPGTANYRSVKKVPLGPTPADQPRPRAGQTGEVEARYAALHADYVKKAQAGTYRLCFVGDSITQGWGGAGQKVWQQEFAGYQPLNLGVGGDQTQHVLWRLQNGEFPKQPPEAVVLMIGTNNGTAYTPEQIAGGVTAIVREIQRQAPATKILLLAIFPRGNDAQDPRRINNVAVNKLIAPLADGKLVKYLDIGAQFLTPEGTFLPDLTKDKLHFTAKGYEIWAAAIKPVLQEWLGNPTTAPATQPGK